MASKPKLPAIPAIPNDVTPGMRGLLSAMREVLQVQAGQGRGDELDKAVTFRDLGLTSMGGSSTAMMGRVINGLMERGEIGTNNAVERPTTPTGVNVSAFVGGIAVSWDLPRYSGHAYTEVFAQPTTVNAQNQPLDPPALDTETMLLGTSASPLLGVQARTTLGYYIWVRHVNSLGQVGSVHTPLGAFLYLPPNPSYLLEQLTNEVTRDQLSVELQTPIDKVPVLETAISNEATTRANADSALSTTLTSVSAVANAKVKTYRQAAAPALGMTTGDLWFDSDDNNKCYRYSGSAWTATDDSRIAANASAITAEQTARADAVSALASDITTVQAYVNGDMTNLFLNPNFDPGQPHGFNNQSLTIAASDPAGACPNEYYCVVRNRDNTGKRIPVTPGDVYSLSMYCCALSASAPQIGIGLFITDRDGTGIAWQLAATRPAGSTSWAKISGDLTIPAGAAYAQFWVQLNYFPGTYYDWAITGLTWVNGNATKALAASVQTNATAIANLDGTYTAQWSTKTTVGALTGGFGVFNDGTTTRFTVHANRFAIMDSSLGNTPFVPFVVDSGRTVIADAFIRTAYIEQLAAGQITAARINALNLNAINITGGTLSLGGGNNMSFQEGGSAGFGKATSGGYGGWGYNWNTIIYNNGHICTNNLTASGGSFTGTVNANAGTFNNVTINDNCDVRGTIYANKIVGDVSSLKNYTLTSIYGGNSVVQGYIATIGIGSSPYGRYLSIPPIFVAISDGSATLRTYLDGVQKSSIAASEARPVLFPAIYIPPNAPHTVRIWASVAGNYRGDGGGYGYARVYADPLPVILSMDGTASFTN